MKSSAAFAFFLLFLAGFALVNLRSVGERKAGHRQAPQVAALAGQEWRLLEFAHADHANGIDIRMRISDDKSLSLDGACNRFTGNFELQDGKFQVSPLAGTKRSCADEAMQVDKSLLELLARTERLALGERTLSLLAADGTELAKFTRARVSGKD